MHEKEMTRYREIVYRDYTIALEYHSRGTLLWYIANANSALEVFAPRPYGNCRRFSFFVVLLVNLDLSRLHCDKHGPFTLVYRLPSPSFLFFILLHVLITIFRCRNILVGNNQFLFKSRIKNPLPYLLRIFF